jgi:hypothetical protein
MKYNLTYHKGLWLVQLYHPTNKVSAGPIYFEAFATREAAVSWARRMV